MHHSAHIRMQYIAISCNIMQYLRLYSIIYSYIMLYMLQNYSCFIMTCAPVPQTVPYWPYWSNSRIQATLTRFHYVSPWLLRGYEKNKQGEPISRWTNHVQRWMSLWNVVHVFFHIGLLPFSTPCYLKQRNAQELNGIKSHWPCMLACGVSIWLNTCLIWVEMQWNASIHLK